MSSPNWIVTIGASAGGIEAMQALFGALPDDLDAAFFVVLHIPPIPPSHLDRVLASATAMPVTVAHDGESIQRGHVYVATADLHLVVDVNVVRQTHGPRECHSRPAVDVLFRSAAVTHGAHVIAVILSGMLDDGTAGLSAVKELGGTALVQEPHEASQPGMPESAIRNVKVDMVAGARDLAGKIRDIVQARPPAVSWPRVSRPAR
jgi:two-component system chemotaxis response regulator CheB